MMKNRKRFVIVVLILTLSALACRMGGIPAGRSTTISGSGDRVEENRTVSGLTEVELATIGTLSVEVGEKEELRIEAEDNLIPYIETGVRSGRLTIETQEGINLRNTQPLRYYLTVKDLDTVVISSSGDIEATDLEAERFSVTIRSSGNLDMGDLVADTLAVKLSSSGNMRIEMLKADTLKVEINSSGNLDIAGGEIERQDITINSSGDYAARDLESAEAEVHLRSNGSATIQVRDYLRTHLSSSGDLRYTGNPTVDATTSSSGDVVRIGG
jgi:hypothetical protein